MGPMVRTGTMAIGPMTIYTLWVSTDISRGQEKEKERKARMMKAEEESQEMVKESPTMFNLRLHRVLLCRINSKRLTTLQ
jgi:hypothetical protein